MTKFSSKLLELSDRLVGLAQKLEFDTLGILLGNTTIFQS